MSLDESTRRKEQHREWVEKILKASNLDNQKESKKAEDKDIKVNQKMWLFLALIFFLALFSRLYFLFFVTNPQNGALGWYNDVYHHWQIAYLTREVGFSHGFLKLWDLKGMEYFWGPLHPWVLSLLFTITGSYSILIPKLLSTIAGSASIVILSLLARRYFNIKVALAVSILTIFNPIGIFTDVSGMQEPLGILLLLLGINFWPKQSFLTGLFFGLASMVRGEYWLLSAGLVLALFIFSKAYFDKKLACLLTYFGTILLYMKYLASYTGNAIYPLWWNFLGNARGEWHPDIAPNDVQVFARYIFGIILFPAIAGIVLTLWKKPKWFLFSLLGLGNLALLAFFIGFTDYLLNYLPRFWLDRIFWLPYLFLSFILAVAIFEGVKKLSPWIPWLFLGIIVLTLQVLWKPIWSYYKPERWGLVLERRAAAAKEVASEYRGGSILVPEDDPVFVYYLVQELKIPGKNIIGQMFDPFYYMTGDPYTDWEKKNRKIIFDWLKKEDIRLLVVNPTTQGEKYKKLQQYENDHFSLVREITNGAYYKLYEITY